jgi:Asp-tRNA(Asn)/Glu-tRNA(Gln) amidotransferase A subunit family amidase
LHYYRTHKELLDDLIAGHVENRTKISRKAQLESYDNVARLRPVLDEIASKYAAILTPSVVDEAPVGLKNTGDSVCCIHLDVYLGYYLDVSSAQAFCSTWTILGTPVVNLPGFVGANGMPIGLSLVAPRYHDMHLLHVAKAVAPVFEQGGFKSAL